MVTLTASQVERIDDEPTQVSSLNRSEWNGSKDRMAPMAEGSKDRSPARTGLLLLYYSPTWS